MKFTKNGVVFMDYEAIIRLAQHYWQIPHNGLVAVIPGLSLRLPPYSKEGWQMQTTVQDTLVP